MFDTYDFDQHQMCQRHASTLTRVVDTYPFLKKMFNKYHFDSPHLCQRHASTLTRDVDTDPFLKKNV
jgi:hypothetical protein